MDKAQKIHEEIEKQLNLLERVAEKLKNGLITSGNVSHTSKVQGYTIENVVNNIKEILQKEHVSEETNFLDELKTKLDSLSKEEFEQVWEKYGVKEKEEHVSEDFENALANEWKGYNDRGAATVDALEDNTQELAFAKGFYRGAKWQKQKDSIISDDLEKVLP